MSTVKALRIEHIQTRKLATADGNWTDIKKDAVRFTVWSDAVAFCLRHSLGDVYLLYHIPGKPDLRLNLFDCELAPLGRPKDKEASWNSQE